MMVGSWCTEDQGSASIKRVWRKKWRTVEAPYKFGLGFLLRPAPIQNGTLNAERYVEEILNEHVGPFMARMDRHGILMHDNARPHTARIVHDYLEEVGIELMQWPVRSPDLRVNKPTARTSWWAGLNACYFIRHRERNAWSERDTTKTGARLFLCRPLVYLVS